MHWFLAGDVSATVNRKKPLKSKFLETAPGIGSGIVCVALDLADQIERRGQRGITFVPLGRADFVRMGGGVLGGLQLAQGFGDVTGDFVGVHFNGLDHAVRVDHEGATQGQAFCIDMHVEGARQLVGRVANQRELGLADGWRGFVPDLVREMGVGGDDVNLGASLLKSSISVGQLKVKAAGMKIITDHLPFRLASVTSMNLPLWKAWTLNG